MQTTQSLQRAAREYRAVADRHDANGHHNLAHNFRAHAAECDRRAEELRPKTGSEFAKAHGNDSSDWTAADFESGLVFAEADAQPAYAFIAERLKAKTTTPELTPAA